MEPLEKQQHGIESNPGLVSQDINSGASDTDTDVTGRGIAADTRPNTAPQILAIPAEAVTLSFAILATGGVAAAMMFIFLCFEKPNEANIIIPLVLYPIIKVAVDSYKHNRAKRHAETDNLE